MRASPAPELRRSPEANPGPRTADTGGQPEHRCSTFQLPDSYYTPKKCEYSGYTNTVHTALPVTCPYLPLPCLVYVWIRRAVLLLNKRLHSVHL